VKFSILALSNSIVFDSFTGDAAPRLSSLGFHDMALLTLLSNCSSAVSVASSACQFFLFFLVGEAAPSIMKLNNVTLSL
jgi:hypothetical protein